MIKALSMAGVFLSTALLYWYDSYVWFAVAWLAAWRIYDWNNDRGL